MSKRIVFTFDERSFQALADLTADGDFASFADTVRTSLVVLRALQQQASQGFSQVKVFNPKSKDERTLVTPELVTAKTRKR